jgi:hypothetical protein
MPLTKGTIRTMAKIASGIRAKILNFFAAAIFFAVVDATIAFLVSDPPGFLAPGGSLVKL